MNRTDEVWKNLCRLVRKTDDSETSSAIFANHRDLIDHVLTKHRQNLAAPSSTWDERLAWRIAIGAVAAAAIFALFEWPQVVRAVASELPTPEIAATVDSLP